MSVNLSVEVMDPSAEGVAAALRRLKKLYLSNVSADVKRHDWAMTRSQRRRFKAKKSLKRDRKAARIREAMEARHALDKIQRRQDGTPIPRGRWAGEHQGSTQPRGGAQREARPPLAPAAT